MNNFRSQLPPHKEWPWVLGSSAVFFVCVVTAHPFVNSSFMDDWSYAYVASKLAQTGHFHYSGWGSPSIVLQSAWAALWIRLVGFSFNLLRIVSLPFALAFVLLTYAVGRKVGLSQQFAFFGSLIIATSPLFLPLACSFMTESYACSFTMMCIYAALSSADAFDSATAKRWLWILLLAGIVGASDRQTVWVAPIVLIPYLIWKWRADRAFRIQGILAYAICLVALVIALRYFTPQYAGTALSRDQLITVVRTQSFAAALKLISFLLLLLWISLPALLCSVKKWNQITTRQLVVIGLLCLTAIGLLMIRSNESRAMVPFIGNILTVAGIGVMGLGIQPVLLARPTQYILTFLFYFVIGIWIVLLWRKQLVVRFAPSSSAVFILFACGYLPLMVPGALTTFFFDRYALPVAPLVIIGILFAVQSTTRSVSVPAYLCLIVFAAYAVLTTHDYFADLEARTTAAAELQKRGVPSNRISTGFERDGWTQMQLNGKIDTLMYGDDLEKKRFWFWSYSRAIRPDYIGIASLSSDHPDNEILEVPYVAWIPPFHRKVEVIRQMPASISR